VQGYCQRHPRDPHGYRYTLALQPLLLFRPASVRLCVPPLAMAAHRLWRPRILLDLASKHYRNDRTARVDSTDALLALDPASMPALAATLDLYEQGMLPGRIPPYLDCPIVPPRSMLCF
jgi:hypothetical protein